MYRLMSVLLLALVQVACAMPNTPQQEATTVLPPKLLVSASYSCAGRTVSITQTDQQQLDVTDGNHVYQLTRALSNDDDRYANVDQQVTWISQRALATFQIGQQIFACHQLADHLYFSAHGNEPFWAVNVDNGEATITGIDASPQTFAIQPDTVSHQVHSYQSQDQSFNISLTDQLCQDDMSGMYYPMQADVVYKDNVFKGCAGDSHFLLAGQWQVIALDTSPALPAMPVTITFNDGQISGSTGCNTFEGEYHLTGESITVDQLFVADKVCGTEQGLQEAKLIALLKDMIQFSVKDDTLTLYTDTDNTILLNRYGA